MPFGEAFFWFGMTLLGVGVYFFVEESTRRVWWWAVGLTVTGLAVCGYAVYAYYYEAPKPPLWVCLLIATWILVGLDVYDRKQGGVKTRSGTSIPEWRQGFLRPRFEIVSDHKFENEEIAVDNKSFRRCSFKNVKLLFRGTAPFEFVEGTTVDAGSVMFTTDDPAVMAFDSMQTKFASLPGAQVQHGALDNKGKPVPQQPIKVVPLSQYPIPDLRLKVITICSELQGFLGTHGQEPAVEHKPQEDQAAFLKRYLDTVMPWRARVLGAYRLEFGDSVPRLRDEIRVRTGLDNFVLNNFIEAAAHNPNGNIKAVEGIFKTFWEMALGINA